MSQEIKIRMYRSGLGDCFLLVLPDKDGNAFNMLVDCGVFFKTENEKQVMRDVASSIAADTANHLHLVAVTHEHYDHLSGFNHAKDIFQGMQIDKIWFSWTEDPVNELAAELREEIAKKANMLHGVVRHLSGMADAPELVAEMTKLSGVLNFFGAAPLPGKPSSTREALRFLAEDISADKKYCYPGKIELITELPDFRFYIMGPPEDRDKIYRINPSKNKEEVYHLGLKDNERFLLGAYEQLNDRTSPIPDEYYPFDSTHRMSYSVARTDPFFEKKYGFGEEDVDPNCWRNVTIDWLDIAGTIALDLDDVTNNTSMVMAIEHIPSGNVFLFPGDAQVGNWYSWENHTWKIDPGKPTEKSVTSRDLLAQTVFYKVGHHGSHNATMREKGLELMNHPELVAMIPVNQAFAKSKKPPATGWKMPFAPLLERLKTKTRGRVIILDEDFPKSENPVDQKPMELTEPEWSAFREACTKTDLYWEIKLPLKK